MNASIPTAGAVHDVFVSYAHLDDEPPRNASKGWVTVLVDELKRVLDMKLGGVDVWMDHELAANENVPATLLSTLRASRTLLLIMSPSYQKSAWCKRELGNFLVAAAATKNKDNVFVVEIEPVPRETWHQRLRDLTAFQFYVEDATGPRLLGYPVPDEDGDDAFWDRVVGLANQIANYVRQDHANTETLAPRPAVVLAEATDDLIDTRESVKAALQQQLFEVLPGSGYPRDTETSYVEALRSDLNRAALFVQLLGPWEGSRPPGSETSFVALQANEAARERQARGLRILKWRAREVDPAAAKTAAYRELLLAPEVHVCGIEEFKGEIVNALSAPEPASPQPPSPKPPSAPPPLPGVPPASTPPGSGPPSGSPLSIYINADVVDREVAEAIGDALVKAGVEVVVSPLPAPGQTPEEIRLAQQTILETSDGAVIVYGRAPDTWVVSQFQIDRKVLAQRRGGVWGALLHAPPPGKRDPVKSPSLLTLEYSNGVDPAQLAALVNALRSPGNVGHAP
ncbi:MAG TPA: toll/interleukin-1 receptor domain-containing protein [Candidatus Margulisiibacteriota bacterium]|nr:toll/interleukin-1 receptor domain-containing protein [Candidatus Margulisiibacteriota bacterium]